MRILHVGKFFAPFSGGIENFLKLVLEQGADTGLEAAAIVHHHERGLPFQRDTFASADGTYTVYRVPSHGKLLFAPLSPRFHYYLARVIEDFRPDLLHVHVPNVSALSLPLLDCCRGIPMVLHWHADVVASRFHWGLAAAYQFYRPFETRLLARADRVIVTSPSYLQSSEPLAAWRDKCDIVPLALKPGPSLGPASTPQPVSGLGLKVLCIGRLTYYKGHQVLIKAVAELPDVQLKVVGSGPLRRELTQSVTMLRAEDRIHILGQQSDQDLEALLQDCDCLCLPSIERTEAFGLVLLEAMRAGKPAVVTDVEGSGMAWVVQHEKSGLIARAGDVDSLREALRWLARHPDERQQMGRAGQARLLEHFSIDRVFEQMAGVYQQLVGKR